MILAARDKTLAGWGRYPVALCQSVEPSDPKEATWAMANLPTSIARGNARSYGDASLNPAGVITTRRLNHILAFDDSTGVITCEGGVMLSDILDVFVPRGWFPPVTPGTRFVTVGGMIASDVHGKNHHGAGSFGQHLAWLDLAMPDGRVVRCSLVEEPELFAATSGGMGLTGVVLRASFRMLAIQTARIRQRTSRAPSLRAVFDTFEASSASTYSVAWIDVLAQGASLGRSVVYLGEHARLDELPAAERARPFARDRPRPKRIPFDFPGVAMSRPSVWSFNQMYYHAQPEGDRLTALDPYFYPIDGLLDLNRVYGRRGFVQYQCVLPLAASFDGMSGLLTEVARRGGASFLTVLKRMGPSSFGYLSFPMEGYTLAIDVPVSPENFVLLERLDAITLDHGGRVYLAKDSRASPDAIAKGYPRLGEFRELRRRLGLDTRIQSLQSRRLRL